LCPKKGRLRKDFTFKKVEEGDSWEEREADAFMQKRKNRLWKERL